jgi:hypothetical protein
MSGILWLLLTTLLCGPAIQAARMVLMAKKREHAHEVLLNRVMRLRLYKMLKFLGANLDEYLRAVPAAEINQQIHRCSHCKIPDICDSYLRDGKRLGNMNFCPNYKSHFEHSNTIRLHRLNKHS